MEEKEKPDPSASQTEQNPKEKNDNPATSAQKIKKERVEVITVRTWKEYLGESLLIVFSVILALFLTERFAKLHEEHQTHQVLHQLRDEIISNKKAEEDQYQYHLQVIKRIDLALNDSALAKNFLELGGRALKPLVPDGVLYRDLNDVAWQIAKQNNVFSKIDFSTYSLLTDIYDNQQRIAKSEDEIAKILLSWESRKPENWKTTLMLMRDEYFAWAVDRAPSLIAKYDSAIEKLKNY